jgi:hypothetical protein
MRHWCTGRNRVSVVHFESEKAVARTNIKEKAVVIFRLFRTRCSISFLS